MGRTVRAAAARPGAARRTGRRDLRAKCRGDGVWLVSGRRVGTDARGHDHRHLLARVRGADAQVRARPGPVRTDHRERRRGRRRRRGDRRDRRRRRRLRPSFKLPFAATIRATVVFARRDFSSWKTCVSPRPIASSRRSASMLCNAVSSSRGVSHYSCAHSVYRRIRPRDLW